jgi:co-chaperonin GroES (HSP10)
MKQKEPLTVMEVIESMPLDPEYKSVDNLPIPLWKGVLVKQIKQSSITETKSGILLIEGDAENSTPPHLGIIVAVGPDCPKFIKVGLRCYYNFFVNSYFRIEGENYAKMDAGDVYYIVPPKVLVVEPVKSADTVRRSKLHTEQKDYHGRLSKQDANEKDKKLDKTKGKTRKLN